MFSPDLIDCPANSNMLSPTRTTHVVPMGSQHITTDVDDLLSKRRRNRKVSFQWIGKTVFERKPASTCIRSDDLDPFPCMPAVPHSPHHREKIACYFAADEEEMYALLALVARPVNQGNSTITLKRSKKRAWVIESMRAWDNVRSEAKRKGKKVHLGKVFEICVEKGSELFKGNPLRKLNGRTVFQGNNVQDESSSAALFSELGPSPAAMEAGKVMPVNKLMVSRRTLRLPSKAPRHG